MSRKNQKLKKRTRYYHGHFEVNIPVLDITKVFGNFEDVVFEHNGRVVDRAMLIFMEISAEIRLLIYLVMLL